MPWQLSNTSVQLFSNIQLIKGSSPVEIRTAPVVQVAVDLAVSLDDFFDPNNLISRLAFVLKIDPSTIRVVKLAHHNTAMYFELKIPTLFVC